MSAAWRSDLYGLLARFDGPEALIAASRALREAGYRRFDAHSPYPISELHGLVPAEPRWLLTFLALLGALTLGGGAYAAQYWMSAVDYPINVGGRPLHSWPAFLPASTILALLGAATAAVVWLLVLCGLPRLHHPLFGDTHFARVTVDSFYLSVEARDDRFDETETRALLERLGAIRVAAVRP